MKLYLDTKNRRFVKSASSNVALTTLVLKRRDKVTIELVYVANSAAITPPTGTTASIGLKSRFSDANFLAFADAGTNTLDLYTEPLEAAFATNPASLPALLEIQWGTSGIALRTATLQVELQNSVILGTEATPAAIPDGKATQSEAETGTDNAKWMTPLRVAQAISHLAEFADTTDELSEGTANLYFTEARAAAAAPVQSVASKTGAVTLATADITGLQTALDGKQPTGSYAPATGIAPSAIEGTAVVTTDARLSDARTPTTHTHAKSEVGLANVDNTSDADKPVSAATATALATKATLPTDSSHAFSQSGQSLALQPARAQFVRVTMSFANGSASVQLPSSGQNYDEVIVDANVGANCTLLVGTIELANLNQYYGTGRRLLRFVRKNNIWNLYEHPYHTHTTNELIFAAAPQVATSPGRAGTISYAAGNLYVAVADNQWRRVALATW